ncbi:MAG: DHA2 family efflux MFS transporter permease subunit [Solirubrobacteraceae bacterium]
MEASPANTPDPRRWRALIFLGAAQFMVVLDASIVNVALPSIQTDLHFSQENLQWVVNAYTLAFGGFLLLGGRAADLFGRRRVFIAGLALFSIASLAGGLATSEGWLIAARGVQGLGAAIVSPAALSIVTNTFTEGSERNKALGIWGALAGAGGAVGVLAGGVLTSGLGWEWVLFVNVPIGLGVALAIPRFVDETKLGERTKIDFGGAFAITAGLMVLVYALVKTNEKGWGSAHTIVLLAVSVALIVAFVVIEMRHRAPLVPLRIFRNRSVSSADAVGLLVGASLFSMFFFISLYLQQVLGFSALKSGLSYLPLSVGIILAAGAASQLVTRIGPKPVLAAGMTFVAVGLLLFTSVRPNGSFTGDVLLPSVIVAIGLGLSFVPLTIAAVAGVAEHETGLASGLINTAQQVGGALGLAILSTVANSKIESVMSAAHGSAAARRGALAEGFGTAFTVGAGFAIFGMILTLLFVKGTGRVDPADLAEAGLAPSNA